MHLLFFDKTKLLLLLLSLMSFKVVARVSRQKQQQQKKKKLFFPRKANVCLIFIIVSCSKHETARLIQLLITCGANISTLHS